MPLLFSSKTLDKPLVKSIEQSGLKFQHKDFIEVFNEFNEESFGKYLNRKDSQARIFTSKNSVRSLEQFLEKNPTNFDRKKNFTVGIKATERLEQLGLKTSARAGNAISLAQIIARNDDVEAVDFFCGDKSLDDLPEYLASKGVSVHKEIVYRTELVQHQIDWQPIDGILFFSPTAVYSFFKKNKLREDVPCFCIGATTSEAVHLRCNNPRIEADEPSIESVVQKAIEFFTKKELKTEIKEKLNFEQKNRLFENKKSFKNDLILKALRGENVNRPPVWMMRQAGRYLPDYMKLREKYSFFERVETPELATEITVMPIRQIGTDAAILFSDILVIPQALDVEVQLIAGKGPVLPNPIRTMEQVQSIPEIDVEDRLSYVFEALKMTEQELAGEVPLIGFAGSPWTVFCYMVQGQGSKNFDIAKSFCFQQPKAAHLLLQKITNTTISYLKKKADSGADILQIFDSWGGLLSPIDYETFSLHYIRQIVDALKGIAPVIVFAKGCWFALEEMAKLPVSALGVDWTIKPSTARQLSGGQITLQGNFDPVRLLSPISEIEKMTKKMVADFGTRRYIANLGHGILPNIPVENAKAFVEAVKSY